MLGSCNLVPSRLRAPAATPSNWRTCPCLRAWVAYYLPTSGALRCPACQVQFKAHRQTKDTQPPTPTSTSTSTPAPTLHPPFPWSAIAPAPAPSLTTDPSAEPNCCLSHGLTRVVYSFDHKETSAPCFSSLRLSFSLPLTPHLTLWRGPRTEIKTNSSQTDQEPGPEIPSAHRSHRTAAPPNADAS